MADLRTLRERIKSISSTKKITKAMQLVSSSKLKKYKSKITHENAYMDSVLNMIAGVWKEAAARGIDFEKNERNFFIKTPVKTRLAILLTSERGLCGALNANLVKMMSADEALFRSQGINTKFIIIGKKGFDLSKRQFSDDIILYLNIEKGNEEIIALQAVSKIIELIESDYVSSCDVYLNIFKNALVQLPNKKTVLPIDLSQIDTTSDIPSDIEGDGILTNLLSLYLIGFLMDGILHMHASEHGARMTAMDNATKNANELIDKLTLKLNKTRQAIITGELIEIVASSSL